MDLKISKTNSPPSTVTTIVVPQDIVDEILDYLATDSYPSGFLYSGTITSLQACALVSKSWVQSCQRHLFRIVEFTSRNVNGWAKTFPVPDESPAHHVGDLRVWTGGKDSVPENFFEFTQWFSKLEKISLIGYGGTPPLRTPSLWRLPKSITTLFINTDAVTLVQVRDVMVQLPNLDSLTLLGTLAAMDRKETPGIGTVLKGRFGGNLILYSDDDCKDVVDMLLEIPSGLHFTEAWIYYKREHLLSTVRLVEAFSQTLVKLSHKVASQGKLHPSLNRS